MISPFLSTSHEEKDHVALVTIYLPVPDTCMHLFIYLLMLFYREDEDDEVVVWSTCVILLLFIIPFPFQFPLLELFNFSPDS